LKDSLCRQGIQIHLIGCFCVVVTTHTHSVCASKLACSVVGWNKMRPAIFDNIFKYMFQIQKFISDYFFPLLVQEQATRSVSCKFTKHFCLLTNIFVKHFFFVIILVPFFCMTSSSLLCDFAGY